MTNQSTQVTDDVDAAKVFLAPFLASEGLTGQLLNKQAGLVYDAASKAIAAMSQPTLPRGDDDPISPLERLESIARVLEMQRPTAVQSALIAADVREQVGDLRTLLTAARSAK